MEKSMCFTRRMALVALAAACLPAAAVAAIHVKLAVNDGTSPASLYVTENDSQCSDGPIDCIEVARKTAPDLFFDLERACKSGGPEYKLEQIRIAMEEKDWPSRANPLPEHVADDFYADAYTGVIDLVRGNDGWNRLSKHRIKLKDKNSSAYTVFYEITARQCHGDGTIVLDPSVRNTGN